MNRSAGSSAEQWGAILRARATLFPEAVHASEGALLRLDRAELRRSYRARALETHPDRAAVVGRSETELVSLFQEVQWAHSLLIALLGRRESLVLPRVGDSPVRRPPPAPVRARRRSARPWERSAPLRASGRGPRATCDGSGVADA